MIIHYTTDINLDQNSITLTSDEALHCAKVLRNRIGDEIYVTDGDGALHTCTLREVSKTECTADIESTILSDKRPYQLTIAICPTKKQSRIEWFIEKAVEIGVSSIVLTQTQRTEKSRIKEERLHKIIVSAMKQSKNLYLPKVIIGQKWKDLIEGKTHGNRYIAHCENPETHLAKVCSPAEDCIVAIGPEGDFTKDEIDKALALGWKEVNLGTSRLRTETAGVVVASVLAQINMTKV